VAEEGVEGPRTCVRVVKEVIKSSGYGAVDLTGLVRSVVSREGLSEGLVTVYTPEPACTIIMAEFESSLLQDFERMVKEYCGSSPTLVEALLGKFAGAPVVDGDVQLGAFKKFILLDLSRLPGEKEVLITLEGEFI